MSPRTERTGPVAHADPEQQPDEGYRRALSSRQVQMMALGSAIGVGLFYGSGGGIAKTGPALILSFAIAGIVAFLVMRALGELLTYKPTSGSFVDYAREFLGPFAGYATGWSYWIAIVTACMAEVTAAGHYIAYWIPAIPVWLTAAVALAILFLANLFSVKVFGELEFWFASIKVIAIVAMIVIGVGVLAFGFTGLGHSAAVSNLWSHGGFAPHGLWQVVLVLQSVFFAYTGIELVGSTAGEAANPRRTLRRAINTLPIRIGVFYIGALIVIMSLVPWTSFGPGASPFVQVFNGIGVPAAAGIMNFVVLTAALSGCNANFYVSSRLVRRMASRSEAPTTMRRLSRRSVPAAALTLSMCAIGVGIIINVVDPDKAFMYVTSVSTCGVLWAWAAILICHLRYRARVRSGILPKVDYRMPGAPVTNWIALACIAVVVALLAVDADTRVTLYVGVVWILVLAISYGVFKSRRRTGGSSESSDAAKIQDGPAGRS